MRTECYERDLTENGYTVLASRRIGEYCDTKAEPLKMWLDKGDEVFWPGFALAADSDLPLRRPADLPDYPDNPLPPETDIFAMDPEKLSQQERDEADFCKSWYDILRGKRQDWQCSGFRVFAGLEAGVYPKLRGDNQPPNHPCGGRSGVYDAGYPLYAQGSVQGSGFRCGQPTHCRH